MHDINKNGFKILSEEDNNILQNDKTVDASAHSDLQKEINLSCNQV